MCIKYIHKVVERLDLYLLLQFVCACVCMLVKLYVCQCARVCMCEREFVFPVSQKQITLEIEIQIYWWIIDVLDLVLIEALQTKGEKKHGQKVSIWGRRRMLTFDHLAEWAPFVKMAFTFAAFCYIVALVLSAVLIFFAIFHVSKILHKFKFAYTNEPFHVNDWF